MDQEESRRQRAGELWLADNRQAIAAYADFVAANGVFSDGFTGGWPDHYTIPQCRQEDSDEGGRA